MSSRVLDVGWCDGGISKGTLDDGRIHIGPSMISIEFMLGRGGRRNLNSAAEGRRPVKTVVTISLAMFLLPLAGCLDELTEPTKTELTDKEMILPDGDFWRAVSYTHLRAHET